jgi:hypothetical protein
MQAVHKVLENKAVYDDDDSDGDDDDESDDDDAINKDHDEKSRGHEELLNALINVMPTVLITVIRAYVEWPLEVPEEFVCAISQLMPNELTLIIWDYVMFPALDLCRICGEDREEDNDRQVCTSCMEIVHAEGEGDAEDCCDAYCEVEHHAGPEERVQCPFCKRNWYHHECAIYWGRRRRGYSGEPDAKCARMGYRNKKNRQRYREVVIANFNIDPSYGFCGEDDCVIHYPRL